MRKVTGDSQPGNERFQLPLICFPLLRGENLSLGQLSTSSPVMSFPAYSAEELFGVLHQADHGCLYNFIFFSDTCLSRFLKNIFVNIYIFRNMNLVL